MIARAETPETRYAKSSEGVYIAFQVLGEGPFDLVFIPDWRHHVEAQWEDIALASTLKRLSSFSRLVVFDKRGTGLSDPVSPSALPSLEEWMEDVRIVLDTLDSNMAALMGQGAGGLLALLFAATYPGRVQALVLVNAFARLNRAPDYPWGYQIEEMRAFVPSFRDAWGKVGSPYLHLIAPSVSGEQFIQEWFARMQRLSVSPNASAALQEALFSLDIRPALPTVSAPALVISTKENRYVEVGHGRYLADKIRQATYVELAGRDHYWWYENQQQVLDEVQEFLTGIRAAPEAERVMATVLFTDIVASTEHAEELGDRRWTAVLERHAALSRRQVERYSGRVVKSTGDGILALFDGPGRAIRCGCAIRDAVRGLGLQARVGLHAGEVEVLSEDVAGVAVNLAQRVQSAANPDEVLVSRTVRDLVAGSGIEFDDRGDHQLKGVAGIWRLLSVRA